MFPTFDRFLSLAGLTDMNRGTGVVASSGRDWRGWVTTGERLAGRVASSAWVPRRSAGGGWNGHRGHHRGTAGRIVVVAAGRPGHVACAAAWAGGGVAAPGAGRGRTRGPALSRCSGERPLPRGRGMADDDHHGVRPLRLRR